MDQIKIGKFIQEKRKEKSLTQSELAEKLNVSDRAVSKWENGNCIPDVSNIQELCKILNITINDLFSGCVVDMKDNEKKPFMEWDLVEIKKVNLKNAERFLSKERIDRCSDDHPKMKVYLKDDLRIEKAWNLYCKIREYNMRRWWN